jgi:hypothetical protein
MSSDFRPKKIFGKFMHVNDIPLETKSGKTLVFFLGAGFCPFCAAERWAVVEALKNFGTWENLPEDFSAEKDEKYLNIPTFNFPNASYSSRYVEFQAIETADRHFNAIDNGGRDPYGILENYNPDQIIPFTLIDGQFMQAGCGYSPKLFEGLDHDKVREQILDPPSALGSSIKNETAFLTALMCSTLKNYAEGVCSENNIKELIKQLSAN